MGPDEDESTVWLGIVVAIGALLMGGLAIDGLVSGETVHIGKYRTGVPISGAKGVGIAIAYGTFALALALFAVACFSATSEHQAGFSSWAKKVFITAVLMLVSFSLFLK